MTLELTCRQKEYLLFFADRNGRDAGITAAAENFTVSKPTVSRQVKWLAEVGLLVNNTFGEIELTSEGWEYIQPLLDRQKEIAEWMVTGLGLLPQAADAESRKMVSNLELVSVDACIRHWHEIKKMADKENNSSVLPRLEQGSYEIGFSLLKRGQSAKSMGDAGFQKPAQLASSGEHCVFKLYPRQIEHRPFNLFRIYKGTVDRIWYRHMDVWEEAKAQKDGSFLIPDIAAERYNPQTGLCIIPIRIRAAIIRGKMPESEADLVFDWNSIQQEQTI